MRPAETPGLRMPCWERRAAIGVTLCLPANASAERKRILQLHGAEIIETDPLQGSDGAQQSWRAKWPRATRRNISILISIITTPTGARITEGTGPEIWKQTEGRSNALSWRDSGTLWHVHWSGTKIERAESIRSA